MSLKITWGLTEEMKAEFSPPTQTTMTRQRRSVSPIYDGDKRTEDCLNCELAATAAIDISISSFLRS